MPKVSKETASDTVKMNGLEVRLEHMQGGYSVCFESHQASANLSPLFRGLPDDLCQLPRWGYVLRGKTSFQFAGREEIYEAGDAYYVPPGHIPVHHAGAEIIEFSPTDVLGATMAAVMRNMSHGNIA